MAAGAGDSTGDSPEDSRDRSSGPADAEGPEPTVELIRAARAGEPKGWAELHRRYRAALRVLMRGKVPPMARPQFDTDDLLQSGFLVAVRQLDSYVYEGPGSFERWMRRILERKLKDKLRRLRAVKRGKAPSPLDMDVEPPSAAKEEETPAQIAENAERMTRLALAMGDLSDVEQQVIQMITFDKLPRSEVARQLGKSPTSVRRYLGTGLEKLHHRLNQ